MQTKTLHNHSCFPNECKQKSKIEEECKWALSFFSLD